MKHFSYLAVICLCVLIFARAGAPAQTVVEKESEELDLLAPVHEIREHIKARLAQPAELLDLDLIMEGADFYGTQPRRVRWDSDGSRLWFEWKRWDEEETGTFEYVIADGKLWRLSENEAESVPPAFAVWDKEHRRALWTVRKDVMLYDSRSKNTAPLLSGLEARPLGFAEDGAEVFLMMNNNLMAISIGAEEGAPVIRQLTDIRSGRPEGDEPPTAAQKWLKEQQLELFDLLRRRHDRLEREKEREESLSPNSFYLGGWRVEMILPSPNLAYVAVLQRSNAQKARRTVVPNYITESGYTEDIPARTKVGDDTGNRRLHIIRLNDGAATEVDFGIEDRELMVLSGEWSPIGERLLIGVRAADNKDSWLFAIEPSTPSGVDEEEKETGSLKLNLTELTRDHDDAWLGGMRWSSGGWLPDGNGVWFVSERSGKMHLYTVSAEGGEARALTQGDYIVSGPRISPDKSAFVFSATIPDPFESQTFILPLEGGEPRPLTGGMGRADAKLSPEGERLAVVASGPNTPWELYIKETGDAGVGVKVTDSPSPAFKSYEWVEPPIVKFKAQDGVIVPARIYLPEQPHPNRPAVIFVHGAGYMHNVHRWWSSYEHEYCFHHLLTERGYTVLDIDYRGSAGYGRDWRTAIYRHMGGKDLSDQVDGVRYLVESHGVDPERIGLYGGSYGGFITLMALFTAGDHFAAGAALRPVTDWAAYSHWYTGNILNLPADDDEAYRRSSPIYFAEGLDDPLLICHGVVDTNVHFQGVVRLAQRLIELRKENWEVAIFPVENHGFREPSSWVDEYRRILELFEENLKGAK